MYSQFCSDSHSYFNLTSIYTPEFASKLISNVVLSHSMDLAPNLIELRWVERLWNLAYEAMTLLITSSVV